MDQKLKNQKQGTYTSWAVRVQVTTNSLSVCTVSSPGSDRNLRVYFPVECYLVGFWGRRIHVHTLHVCMWMNMFSSVHICICMCVLLGFGDLGSGFDLVLVWRIPTCGVVTVLYCIVLCYIGCCVYDTDTESLLGYWLIVGWLKEQFVRGFAECKQNTSQVSSLTVIIK